MKKNENVLLTPAEMTFFLIGCMVRVVILSLPNDAIKASWQDGWIAVILAGLYPLYILLLAKYIIKKYPNNNVIQVSKKVLGKYIGTFLNIIFALQFLYYLTNLISVFDNLVGVYAVSFISKLKITLVVAFLGAYAAHCGIKTLAKLNVLAFFITVLSILFSATALKDGSILNVMPIMGSGIKNIMISTTDVAHAFRDIEIILLVYPFMQDPKQAFKAGAKALGVTVLIYTWAVFITIFYLGPDITSRSFWPFVMVTDSVQIPVINDFRYVFISMWIIIMFKTISNKYFVLTFSISNIIPLDRKKICIYLFPLVVGIPLLYGNEVIRRSIYSYIVPKLILFNILYITLISILIFFKGDGASAKKV